MNDTSSTVNHNAYMASAPQIDYAPIAHHPLEFSSLETGLVVPVFQKEDDPIDAINHMMYFLTSVVTSRGGRIICRLVHRDRLHQEQEEHLEGKGTNHCHCYYGGHMVEHTKACFPDDIIPFVKSLKELFTSFDQCLIDEVTEVQNVFTQMEMAVEQHCKEKTKVQIKMKNVLQENDRLLTQAQAKDTVILKLKEKLNSLDGDVKDRNVKRDIEEIETLNIELDHKVIKLAAENEHLKQTYKQLYDSVKSSRELEEIETINIELDHRVTKLVTENEHLKQTYNLQEKVLVITALKDTLRKLKGKAVVDEAVTLHHIDLELMKINVAPLAPKLRNNRTVHCDYLKHTQKETATLKEFVENERLLNPLNTSLDYACKYTKRIQELLIILKQTCPCINDLGDKLMAVTPVNKTKNIRFTEPITSGNIPIKIASSLNVVSNKPMLSSTGVNLPTSASGSQPSDNIKKDRIQ
nr:pyruvate, phosphate dikinase regulatory protein, chloroplastic [Tanacetum cinerariifolium]